MNPHLPVDDVLPEIVASLRELPRLVVQAPAGAGKTTRVPPALLDAGFVEGEILLLEPRRVAARAVARRIASERGCALGEEVGYQVRFERRVSRKTRLTVMTEGILTRRLQDDPLLDGVGAVILDEFHERSVHTDLAIAFLKEIQSVREELLIVVMSATLAAEQVADYLDCPAITSQGRLYPIDVSNVAREPESLEAGVYAAVRDVLADPEDDGGDVLVFLPGAREIQRCARSLSSFEEQLDICPLYGALPPEAQDRAIEPGPRRKVILSTNIAETSLTIEGVTTVVDSGLVKMAFADPATGFDRLETRWISMASAQQRAGRAGRVKPGRAVRLWPRPVEFRMPDFDEPEIRRVDVVAPVLEVLAWSGADPEQFDWFEAPSTAALGRATELLRAIHALDQEGFAVTEVGKRLVELPVHPRLGRALVAGEDQGCGATMAAVAAVLSEDDFVRRVERGAAPARSDVLARAELLEEVAAGRTQAAGRMGLEVHVGRARRVDQVRRQLQRLVEANRSSRDPDAPLRALLAGYPDRIGFRRDDRVFVLATGTAVVIGHESLVKEGDTIVALSIFGTTKDGRGGADYGIVRLASRVERGWVEDEFPERFRDEVEVAFDEARERVMARKVRRFDEVVLGEEVASVEKEADPRQVASLLAEAASKDLVRAFGLGKDDAQFLDRWRCLRQWKPELGLPSLELEAEVDAGAGQMLTQICWGKRSFADLRRVDLPGVLKGYLNHEQLRALEDEAPAKLQVPSGSHIRLDYTPGKPPVLAVRLQEVFGWAETPRLAGGRVPVLMHLLAPNYRPVQVTQDLHSFWENTYPEVRKEMRARYPKHPWPEDPWSAKAIRK